MTPQWVGCPWCVLQVQGCRCPTPCDAAHCVAAGSWHVPAAAPDPIKETP